MTNILLSGYLRNNAGTAINGATVELFDDDSTTPVLASTTTNSSGFWSFSRSPDADGTDLYDVRLTNGSSIRFLSYKDQAQMETLEVANFRIRNPANSYTYDIVPAAVVADRTLTLPLITGGDTLPAIGLAQTWSAIQTHSADIIMQDGSDYAIGTGSDALLRWSTADSSAHTLVLALDNTNQSLQITDVGAIATDWALTDQTHPTVYIHSNTTPATDYLRIGGHDGTTAYIDNVGGTTLAFQIAGATEVSIAATGLTLPANSDLLFTGTTGTNEIVLTDSLADALSVTDGSADVLVIDTSTSGNVMAFTAAFTVSGAVSLDDTTASTSGTTGSLHTDGGLGVVLDIFSDATVNAAGDTAAGDNAAMGYTSSEGLILTGQGSTNDVTIKNDADADVITIATGATSVDIVGDVTALTVNADGDTAAGDNAAMGYTSGEGLILTGQGSTSDVTIKNDADATIISIATGGTAVSFNDGDITNVGDISLDSLSSDASGQITITPTTDTVFSNGTGVIVGHTAQVTVAGIAAELQILGTGHGDSATTQFRWSNDASPAYVLIGKSRGTTVGSNGVLSANDELVQILFEGDDSAAYRAAAAISVFADGTWGAGDVPGRMVFYTVPDGSTTLTEALRITNGQVLTTLGAAPSNVTAAGAGIFKGGISFTDAAAAHIDDGTHGSGTTTIYIGNQTITTSSDERLKVSVEDSRVDALETIGKLRVVDYNWGENYGAHAAYNSRGRWTGMLAQETAEVVPYIINRPADPAADWFVQYEHLVPMLVKALQETTERLNALEAIQ